MESDQDGTQSPEEIELPAPTSWPIVTAFGLALLFAGLVTSLAVSLVGLLVLLRGAIGWFQDVLPVPKVVHVEPVAVTAPKYVHPKRTVDYVHAGVEGHRVYIPVRVHPYSAGLMAGIQGGIGMAIIACLYGLVARDSVWYPINLLAAAALPSLADAGPGQLRVFHWSGLIVAVISHGFISLLVGLLYAAILPMMPSRFAAFWGSFLAPVLWTALIASTLQLVNPTLNKMIDWKWFIASQIAYGLIAGYVVHHSKMVETAQHWPLAARAGLEAPGLMPERRE